MLRFIFLEAEISFCNDAYGRLQFDDSDIQLKEWFLKEFDYLYMQEFGTMDAKPFEYFGFVIEPRS